MDVPYVIEPLETEPPSEHNGGFGDGWPGPLRITLESLDVHLVRELRSNARHVTDQAKASDSAAEKLYLGGIAKGYMEAAERIAQLYKHPLF